MGLLAKISTIDDRKRVVAEGRPIISASDEPDPALCERGA